jgi:DNA processing protein
MEFPIVTLKKDAWPELLAHIPDTPKQLYLRGALADSSHKILAVVGSRAASTYGKEVTRKLIEGLRGYPITIVSGLAIGIDTCAHEAALAAGLHTVSVPGSGISDSVLYPARNKRLAHRILESGGALLSEFAPDFRATPWSFPARNRIMAGMSHAVLVIEAEQRSGTLITSKLATEYNRDVFTVPGSIFASQSAGPHMLIRLGATPITSPKDVLEALGFDTDDTEEKVLPELSADEQKIYNRLTEPCTRHELIAACNIPASGASILISLLELKGVITEFDGLIRRS